jgi:hypothetical protein
MKERRSGIEERKVIEFIDGPMLYVPGGISNYETNEEYILNAMPGNPEIFQYVRPALYIGESFILEAAQRKILADMRRGNLNALVETDIVLPRDAGFLLQAVKYNPAALFIALIKTGNLQFFQENVDFIKAAIEANWNVLLDCLSSLGDEYRRVFDELTKNKTETTKKELETMLQDLQSLIKDLIKIKDQDYIWYDKTRSELNVRGITSHPYWIKTYEEAQRLIDCQKKFTDGKLQWINKPIIVMLYPRTDARGFYDNNSLSRMIEKGNTVLLFEIGHDWEIFSIFQKLANKLPAMQEICLIIGGHESANNVITFNEKSPDGSFNLAHFSDKSFVDALHKLNIRKVFLETYAGDTKASIQGLLDKLVEHVRLGGQIYAPEVNKFAPEYWLYDGVPSEPMYKTHPTVLGKCFDLGQGIQYEIKKLIFGRREEKFNRSRLQQEMEENWRIYNELYR